MDLTKLTAESKGTILPNPKDLHWSHHVAATSLVAGAVLLLMGRKRQAMVIAGAGAAMTLLERPEAAQELWAELPNYIRNGQDFLVRAETFIEKFSEQAARLREVISRQV